MSDAETQTIPRVTENQTVEWVNAWLAAWDIPAGETTYTINPAGVDLYHTWTYTVEHGSTRHELGVRIEAPASTLTPDLCSYELVVWTTRQQSGFGGGAASVADNITYRRTIPGWGQRPDQATNLAVVSAADQVVDEFFGGVEAASGD